jgi:hypothetical protein
MQILSWNVNGRVQGACRRQLDRVLGIAPHVIALQEVTLGSYPAWLEGLEAADYSVVSTVDLARLPTRRTRSAASTSTSLHHAGRSLDFRA